MALIARTGLLSFLRLYWGPSERMSRPGLLFWDRLGATRFTPAQNRHDSLD